MNDFKQIFIRHFLEKGPAFISNVVMALIILILGVFASRFASRSAKQILSRGQAYTIAPVVAGLVKVSVIGASVVTALSHLGIDIGAILAGAGVLGLAVGFGAQALVKDLISGFFLIFDGVVAVNDVIRIDQAEGVVEAVGLRMTRIRAFDGRLWYVPNGSINTVANFSREWARAIVEISVGPGTQIDEALYKMKQVADSFSAEKKSIVLEAPDAQGVISLTDSAVQLRVVVKVKASEKGSFEFELRKRLVDAFNEAGFQPAHPHQVTIEKHFKNV